MNAPPLHAGRKPLERISPRTTTAVLATIAVFFYFVKAILFPFVMAGAIAYAATPLIEWLKRITRAPRSLCAAAVFLALLAIGSAIGLLAVPPFAREFVLVMGDLTGTLQAAAHKLIGDRTIDVFGQRMNAAQIARRATDVLLGWLSQGGGLRLATASLTSVFGLFLIIVLLFYFLVGGPKIAIGLFWLAPPKQRPLIEAIWVQVNPALKRYFLGVAVVVAYASTAAYIGLGLVLGLHHAALLALLTGLLEMIPVIGPALSAVIAGLVAVRTATGLGAIVGYAVYATLLRISIDQLLGPLVLGHAARVHPVVIMFCFLAGGLLFGVAGVILAVPLALTIKITLATLYEEPIDSDEPPPELTVEFDQE